VGDAGPDVGPVRLHRRGREQRLHPPGAPGERHRPHPLGALLDGADAAGLWTVQTGIFPENTASVTLHEACGFRIVGTRERIGQLDGVWRDVLFVERRRTDDG
jgi:phosphinothricin acetyltransferase